jgi:16S rRNA (guanine966-N2)-methyltransferase
MIQISGGTLRSRKIKSLEGRSTRPTQSKVREAVFNILNSRFYFEDFKWVDLFGGSGIMSFEAISRGFPEATLIENNPKAAGLIRENIQSLQLQQSTHLHQQDAMQWLNTFYLQCAPSVFFIDPPYQSDFVQKIVDFIRAATNGLGENILVIETDSRITWDYPDSFQLFKTKKYGSSRLDFLQSNEN